MDGHLALLLFGTLLQPKLIFTQFNISEIKSLFEFRKETEVSFNQVLPVLLMLFEK